MKYPDGAIALVQMDAFREDLQKIIKKSIEEAIQNLDLEKVKQQAIAHPNELLSRNQAANFLNISLPTLTKYMLQGNLQYSRIGRKILFSKEQILESIKILKNN